MTTSNGESEEPNGPLELNETLTIETNDGTWLPFEVVGILEESGDAVSYAVLRREVGIEVRKMEVKVAVVQQCCDYGLKQSRLVRTEPIPGQRVYHSANSRTGVIAVPRVIGASLDLDLCRRQLQQSVELHRHLRLQRFEHDVRSPHLVPRLRSSDLSVTLSNASRLSRHSD